MLSVENYKLLVYLVMYCVQEQAGLSDMPWDDNNRPAHTLVASSAGRGPLSEVGFARKVSVTQCHTSDDDRPLTHAGRALSAVKCTCILIALACSICKVDAIAVHAARTGPVIKAMQHDRVGIAPGSSM